MTKRTFYFNWNSSPTEFDEHRLYQRFIRKGYYSEPELHHLNSVDESEDRKTKILSLLKLKLTEKAGYRHHLAHNLFPEKVDEFKKLGIFGMACQHDIPPHAIHSSFKTSLEMGTIADSDNSDLSDWLKKQGTKAWHNDITSPKFTEKFKTQADNFESQLVDYFKRYGIRIKTEEHLKVEQVAEHGRAIATVDIFFLDEVYINGQLIKWMECKDYILAKNKIVGPKVKRQLSRYTKLWGAGAVVYSHGYLFDFPLSDVMTLDASDINQIEFVREDRE